MSRTLRRGRDFTRRTTRDGRGYYQCPDGRRCNVCADSRRYSDRLRAEAARIAVIEELEDRTRFCAFCGDILTPEDEGNPYAQADGVCLSCYWDGWDWDDWDIDWEPECSTCGGPCVL